MSPLPPTPLAYWVNDLSPFLVRFSDSFGIRYYGIAYLLGFLVAAWMLHGYARAGRSQVPREKIGDFMIAVIIGVLAGGRLGYFLLYQIGSVGSDPLALLRVWEGGMSSHGGMAGVAVAVWWFGRTEKISFFHLADLVAAVAPAGLFFGRVANFINGELWGKVTNVSWAVIFPHSAPGQPVELIPPRHPSQLYEAALEGLLMMAFMQWRFWKSDVMRAKPGRLNGEFLVVYAAVRMIGETFREPDAGLVLGLTRGTFYSVFLIGAGIALIARRQAKG